MGNNLEWLKHPVINKSVICRRLNKELIKLNLKQISSSAFISKLNNRIFDKLKNPKQEPIINHFSEMELVKLKEIKKQIFNELFLDCIYKLWDFKDDNNCNLNDYINITDFLK